MAPCGAPCSCRASHSSDTRLSHEGSTTHDAPELVWDVFSPNDSQKLRLSSLGENNLLHIIVNIIVKTSSFSLKDSKSFWTVTIKITHKDLVAPPWALAQMAGWFTLLVWHSKVFLLVQPWQSTQISTGSHWKAFFKPKTRLTLLF